MGCLCCRDREKPVSDSPPLNTLPRNSTNRIENPTYRSPTLHSESLKQTSQSTNARLNPEILCTPQSEKESRRQLRVSTVRSNLNDLVKPRRSMKERPGALGTNVSSAVKVRESRVVLGGLGSCYHLTEAKCGNLVQAVYRETNRKCWIQTYELKRETGLKEAKRELGLMKSLDHPNVLKVLDLLQEGCHMHAVYEATEGGNAQALPKELDEVVLATVLRQVFAALRHCRSKGLTLKPISLENVLLVDPITKNADIRVKLLVPFSARQDSAQPYIAPEQVSEALIGQANCLWSCGELLSALLTGSVVSQQKEAFSKEIKASFARWRGVSAEAKSFAQLLLSRDYRKRPTLEQCLHHPWIAATPPQPTLTPALRTTLRNMAKFRPATSLKKALLQLMLLFVLSPEDLREVKEAFAELDTDMDGAVSLEELRVQLNRLFPEEQAQTALTAITSTAVLTEGKLAYSEFLLWGCSRKVFASIDLLDAAFKLLDRDRDGAVGQQDLKEFLCLESEGCSDSMAWKGLISSISNDSRGAFHYEDLGTFIQKH